MGHFNYILQLSPKNLVEGEGALIKIKPGHHEDVQKTMKEDITSWRVAKMIKVTSSYDFGGINYSKGYLNRTEWFLALISGGKGVFDRTALSECAKFLEDATFLTTCEFDFFSLVSITDGKVVAEEKSEKEGMQIFSEHEWTFGNPLLAKVEDISDDNQD